MVKGYYRLISTIDDNVGRLREVLAASDLAENTVIIFLGDNGYFLGERNQSCKWLMYENSLRVPFMVYDPQSTAARSSKQIALNIDVAPTVLDYAGVAIPEQVQGRSLRPLVQSDAENWRTDFVCEHLYELPYIPKSEGIRTEDWKYFRYVDQPEVEELYHLAKDPLELVNLIDDPAQQQRVATYRQQLEQKTNDLTNARQK